MSERRRIVGLVTVSAALLLCLAMTAEQISMGPSFCVFKLGTGIDCPGCGMTRALAALLHGDIEAAVGLHPLVVVVFPVLAAIWLALFIETAWRKPLLSAMPAYVVNRFSIVLIALFIGVWIMRTIGTFSHEGLGCLQHSIIHRIAQAVT